MDRPSVAGPDGAGPPDIPRARRACAWVLACFAFVCVYFVGLYPGAADSNQRSHHQLLRALGERGTADIEPELRDLGSHTDVAVHDGRRLSNKAPGLSVAALPAYWLLRRLLPAPASLQDWLVFYGSRVLSVTLAVVLAAAVFVRPSAATDSRAALSPALALRAAVRDPLSGLRPVVLLPRLHGRPPVPRAYALATHERGLPSSATAGFLAAAAVATEYPAALIALCLAIEVARRGPAARLAAFFAGARRSGSRPRLVPRALLRRDPPHAAGRERELLLARRARHRGNLVAFARRSRGIVPRSRARAPVLLAVHDPVAHPRRRLPAEAQERSVPARARARPPAAARRDLGLRDSPLAGGLGPRTSIPDRRISPGLLAVRGAFSSRRRRAPPGRAARGARLRRDHARHFGIDLLDDPLRGLESGRAPLSLHFLRHGLVEFNLGVAAGLPPLVSLVPPLLACAVAFVVAVRGARIPRPTLMVGALAGLLVAAAVLSIPPSAAAVEHSHREDLEGALLPSMHAGWR